MSVTNNVAERAVKLVTDFVNEVDGEGDRQSLLLSVQRRRDQVKGAQTKKEMEKVYKDIVEKDGSLLFFFFFFFKFNIAKVPRFRKTKIKFFLKNKSKIS